MIEVSQLNNGSDKVTMKMEEKKISSCLDNEDSSKLKINNKLKKKDNKLD
jgi:DNA-binding protein